MTNKDKWDCFVLVCFIIGIVNFIIGFSRIIAAICLIGIIIIGVSKRCGLSWGVFGK